jgi:hypothetical protein
MYALLKSGCDSSCVNSILTDEGLILSDTERGYIKTHIDRFNTIIDEIATGSNVHLIDIGSFLNDILTREEGQNIGGVQFNRRWRKGNGFCLDGVHISHTAHALIANEILEGMNIAISGLNAKTYALSDIQSKDPYVDEDEDGWLKGRDISFDKLSGRTKLLYLLQDLNDDNPDIGARMDAMDPDKIWDLISDVLLDEIIDIAVIRAEAERLGIVPVKLEN